MKKILIFDAANLFIRNWLVNPTLARNGLPVGGLVGTICSIQKAVNDVKPDRVFLVYDGPGGSTRRRQENKNYKEGRKPLRLNRYIKTLSEDEEMQNKIWQMSRLFEYVEEMPIVQLMHDGVEADDVIAYITKLQHYENDRFIIVSSDKDFIQILNNRVILYRPMQSEILNIKSVLEKYNIHPNNFALARAISGDKSDNLGGVKGAGLTTVAKRFPFLAESKEYLISDVIQYSNERKENKIKLYNSVLEGEEKIKENYKLMQLSSPNISIQDKNKIKYRVEHFVPKFNKTSLLKMLISDGIEDIKWESLFCFFNRIVVDK